MIDTSAHSRTSIVVLGTLVGMSSCIVIGSLLTTAPRFVAPSYHHIAFSICAIRNERHNIVIRPGQTFHAWDLLDTAYQYATSTNPLDDVPANTLLPRNETSASALEDVMWAYIHDTLPCGEVVSRIVSHDATDVVRTLMLHSWNTPGWHEMRHDVSGWLYRRAHAHGTTLEVFLNLVESIASGHPILDATSVRHGALWTSVIILLQHLNATGSVWDDPHSWTNFWHTYNLTNKFDEFHGIGHGIGMFSMGASEDCDRHIDESTPLLQRALELCHSGPPSAFYHCADGVFHFYFHHGDHTANLHSIAVPCANVSLRDVDACITRKYAGRYPRGPGEFVVPDRRECLRFSEVERIECIRTVTRIFFPAFEESFVASASQSRLETGQCISVDEHPTVEPYGPWPYEIEPAPDARVAWCSDFIQGSKLDVLIWSQCMHATTRIH